MNLLSSLDRQQIIHHLSTGAFDLTIIGGGITGAGIALDAASRGLKVALVEKSDFASGTSSKSTKLIHGGLRYLKQFEVGLVREVGRERAIVHRLAPHLVTSEKMLLPLVQGGTYGGLATNVGLWVYDVLAGVEGEDKRKMLDREEALGKEPLLRRDILTGAGFYAEYRTDDARLTIENIKTAVKHGAICLNYVKATGFQYDDEGHIRSVSCQDMAGGESFAITSRFVVSAAGPWVDQLRAKDNSLQGKRLFLSKGVHIVVSHDRFPVRNAVYFDVPDGRMIFAIPRHRATYIGTTDTPYDGDLNDVPVYQEDVDYLLEAVNSMFPEVGLKREDVESSWAGLRPLIYEEGKSASEMSRKDELFVSDSGLISIAGGKLTGYRKMAEKVVDFVVDAYPRDNGPVFRKNYTDKIPLTGGPFAGPKAVAAYQAEIEETLKELGLTGYHAHYLVANYGRQSDEIIEKMKTFSDEPEVALARAEAWYTIHQELVWSPLDFFNRRTGRLYFDLPGIAPVMEAVLRDFVTCLDWSGEKRREEKEKLESALRKACSFVRAEESENVKADGNR